jgi:tRNA pseudouridine55 synthase
MKSGKSRHGPQGIGGWIILDKPSGMTSRAAGGRIARMFGVKKFGHLGTLDPMASGVLPIALGEATKMIPFLETGKASFKECAKCKVQSAVKEYLFGIKWGIRTDTDDITGNIIEQDDNAQCPTPSALAAVLPELVGEIDQVPPAYSAVHIDGKRAYELARRGIEFEMPSRKVTIYGLEMVFPDSGLAADAPPRNDTCIFKVRCSAGTYVRTLGRDIARLAGGYLATVDMIRRTRTHMFEIKNAATLDFLENLYNNTPAEAQKHLRPVDFGLDDILVLEIDDKDANLFRNGGFIETNGDGLRRVYSGSEFIGMGIIENSLLKPKRIITSH